MFEVRGGISTFLLAIGMAFGSGLLLQAGSGLVLKTNSSTTGSGYTVPAQQYLASLSGDWNRTATPKYGYLMGYGSGGSGGSIFTTQDAGIGFFPNVAPPAGKHIVGVGPKPGDTKTLGIFTEDGYYADLLTNYSSTSTWQFSQYTAPKGEFITGFTVTLSSGWFYLTAVSQLTAPPFTFVHLSDLHVSRGTSSGGDTNGARFASTVARINALSPEPAFVAVSGDITNWGEGSDGNNNYTEVLNKLVQNPANHLYYTKLDAGRYRIPVYFTPGNHDSRIGVAIPWGATLTNYDARITTPTSDPLLDAAHQHDGNHDYAVTQGSDTLIVFVYSGADSGFSLSHPKGAGLTDAQWNWLNGQPGFTGVLRLPFPNKIVVMHHPPFNGNGRKSEDCSLFTDIVADSGSLSNHRTEFLNLCASQGVKLVLAGHEHQDEYAVNQSVPYVQTGGGIHGDYRVISVTGATVSAGLPASCEFNSCNGRALHGGGMIVPTSVSAGTVSGSVQGTTGIAYLFNAIAGKTYTFCLGEYGGTAGYDTWLCLLDSSGNPIAQNDDYHGILSHLSFTPTSSGTYYIAVSGYGSSAGSFTLAYWNN